VVIPVGWIRQNAAQDLLLVFFFVETEVGQRHLGQVSIERWFRELMGLY
jgi:hypothetical protein